MNIGSTTQKNIREKNVATSSRRYCSVPGCGKRGVSMFLFPKDSERRRKWKSVCKVQRAVSDTMFVCFHHFSSKDIILTFSGRRRLKEGAVPSLNLPEAVVRKSSRNCSIHGCTNGLEDGVSMHFFPTDEYRRVQWASVCRLVTTPSRNTRICSNHFHDSDFVESDGHGKILRTGALPSLNLPSASFEDHQFVQSKLWTVIGPCCSLSSDTEEEDSRDQDENSSSKSGLLQPSISHLRIENIIFSKPVCFKIHYDNLSIVQQLMTVCIQAKLSPELRYKNPIPVPDYLNQVICHRNFLNPSPLFLNNPSPLPITDRKMYGGLLFSDSVTTDAQLKVLTGISFPQLECLSQLLTHIAPNSTPCHLPTKERIVLTLFKLRKNLSFECLSIFFKINRHSCMKVFNTTIYLLALVFRPAIHLPSKEENIVNIPTYFKKFPDMRIILNSSEFSIDPTACLQCQVHLNSHYKANLNIKVLLGIAPFGLIVFLSKCYTSQTSDSKIFEESELVSRCMVEPSQDAIGVDTEFCIDLSCNTKSFKLHRFPLNSKTGPARRLVETAMRKMKEFLIISNKLSWSVAPQVDNIMTVIAGLVNLDLPIVSGMYGQPEKDCGC